MGSGARRPPTPGGQAARGAAYRQLSRLRAAIRRQDSAADRALAARRSADATSATVAAAAALPAIPAAPSVPAAEAAAASAQGDWRDARGAAHAHGTTPAPVTAGSAEEPDQANSATARSDGDLSLRERFLDPLSLSIQPPGAADAAARAAPSSVELDASAAADAAAAAAARQQMQAASMPASMGSGAHGHGRPSPNAGLARARGGGGSHGSLLALAAANAARSGSGEGLGLTSAPSTLSRPWHHIYTLDLLLLAGCGCQPHSHLSGRA